MLSFDELDAILPDNWIWATARQDVTPLLSTHGNKKDILLNQMCKCC
jgi:hypothetical protein